MLVMAKDSVAKVSLAKDSVVKVSEIVLQG
jgi:hypothetical protein